ncbi:MAG: Type II secretion system protein F [Chlamydiales bacterium]|nr:Type II secretion system protein F [Chlamydiales bacterium]
MELYQYRYINAKGHKKTGLIDAHSSLEAKEKLRAQNILVLSLALAKNTKQSFFKKKQKNLKTAGLITFTTQLAGLLTAGMPLYESLLAVEEQYRNEAYHPLLLTLCEQVKGGVALSEALLQFPKSFSPLYCSMIAAGESVGALDSSLEKLALLLSKQDKLKKQLSTAMIYPLVLFCFSGLVCFLLMTFVIPSLQTLFEDREVNQFTRLVMQISHFLTHRKLIYLPLLTATLATSIYTFSTAKGKLFIQKTVLKIPILNTLIIQTSMARFARTMGTLLQGGVSIIQALQIGRKVMRNPLLEEIIEQSEHKIVEGSLLSIELKKFKLIPSLVPRLLAIGEEGGSTPLMFQKIADLYEGEVEKTLNRVTALAQPVILIIMGGVVGLIMLAVLLPLTDVNAFL